MQTEECADRGVEADDKETAAAALIDVECRGSSKGHLGALPVGVLEDVLAACMHPATLCAAACSSKAMHEVRVKSV